MKLTYEKCNEQAVHEMVGKAMCAYANWMTARDGNPKLAIACQSEYEATVRCLAMIVNERLYAVCTYVINAAKEEFGI